MTRRSRRRILALLILCAGGLLLTPQNAAADPPPIASCYPNSPGHFVYDYPYYGQVCSNGGCTGCGPGTCQIGWQVCWWDCVSDPDESGNTHPEGVVCTQPDICHPYYYCATACC
jgi:hypothetical protein